MLKQQHDLQTTIRVILESVKVKLFLAAGMLLAIAGLAVVGGNRMGVRVGQVINGATVVATGQLVRPYGQTLEFNGRPVDAIVSKIGKLLFVKDKDNLRIVDCQSLKELQSLPLKGGASLHGIALGNDGKTVYVTNAENSLHQFTLGHDNNLALKRSIDLPGPDGQGSAFPCGIAISMDEQKAYVCLSRNNTLGVVDIETGKLLRQIKTGIAPYDVVIYNGKAFVSNMGGRFPIQGERTADTSGTEAPVTVSGLVKTGTVSVIDLDSDKSVAEIEVGLQPSDILMLPQSKRIAVANSNQDSVTLIDADSNKVVTTFNTKPDSKLPFGSMPNALAVSADEQTLYVANAGNNAVGLFGLDGTSKGFIPTGWYPGALCLDGDVLYVVNNKGVGSRSPLRKKEEGWNSHDHRGSIQKLTLPDEKELASLTARVLSDAMVPQTLAALERKAKSDAKPKPIPSRLGDPSLIEHVIYVIKENRTYDQLFGDVPTGDGDKSLCMYPEAITPNHHALAKNFVLLDNYYCNGVLSADGHSWATEGNVTPYLDKAFGGFNRSYTFGDDPLTYSSTGFIWEAVLSQGLSFRNYGEMDDAGAPSGMDYQALYKAYTDKTPVKFKQNIKLEHLRSYSCPDSPGWNMAIPDQFRVDAFLREFDEYKRNGQFPNFVVIYLPQDHTGGGVTPRAHLEDNDLAIGRLVDAISHSQYWKSSAIFINEDDPQGGFDHVDGHRSLCLVVSPFTQQAKTVSEFYNQTSVLHTIERILGVSPMNQRDASSSLMTACFTEKPNMATYTAIPNSVPLNETPPPKKEMSAKQLFWTNIVSKIPIAHTGMKTAEDDLNLTKYLWFMAKGFDTPFPSQFYGYHGRGLFERGLKQDKNAVVDD